MAIPKLFWWNAEEASDMAIPKLFWWNAEEASIISPPFSARAVYDLTAFSIKQWLLQRLFTALAVHCIGCAKDISVIYLVPNSTGNPVA